MELSIDQGAPSQGDLVQVPGRRLSVEVQALAARSGYAMRDGALLPDNRITGHARLDGDSLGLSGGGDDATEMPLAIRPLPEVGTATRMLLVLAHGSEAPGFHATLWLPPAIFASLRQDVETGLAGRLVLTAPTSLWLDPSERETPAGRPVAWKLGRDAEGVDIPARGIVETIAWGAALSPPFASPAIATDAEDEPEEPLLDALTRLNWSLKQIALVLVFLMIVIALK